MERLAPVFMIGYLALGIFQIFAFMEGLDVWFGFGAIASVIAFVVAMFLGPLGGLAIAVVGYVGATDGWRWEWWQAILLCFPFVVLSFLTMSTMGLFSLLRKQ